MYYYIYEIINKVNGKIYIGVHKTNNLDDGYMGSGKLITSAISKHGIENFHKTILEFFETYEDALAKEKEIVDDEFLMREDTYNIRRGGSGGFDYINKNGLNYLQNNPKFGPENNFYGKKHTHETKSILAEKTRQNKAGVPLTDEHKNNISKALVGIVFTEERRSNISNSKKGKPAHNKGVPAERWICPHCAKEGGGLSNKNRYHFDNCKEKENAC